MIETVTQRAESLKLEETMRAQRIKDREVKLRARANNVSIVGDLRSDGDLRKSKKGADGLTKEARYKAAHKDKVRTYQRDYMRAHYKPLTRQGT